MNPAPVSTPFPLDQADLCVKCGLCLPHCPTYGLTQHEGDSPRGRISLMQGLATGALDATTSLRTHLDGCLGCRACEKVCPAKVPYGLLIDAGRAQLATRAPTSPRRGSRLTALLTRNALQCFLRCLLWFYTRSGAQRATRAMYLLGKGRLARLESLLPERIESRQSVIPVNARQARAQLFTGCASSIADQATLNAVRRLCARTGIDLEEPDTQGCCGALDQHDGRPAAAARHVTRNLDAFPGAAPIIWCASGCGATLREYDRLSVDPRAATFAQRATDIHTLLARHWSPQLKPRALAARAALHLPCTQRNVTGGSDTIRTLLGHIPQLQVEVLRPSSGCCGAAGRHLLTHPEQADRLLEPLLEHLAADPPDYLLSSNIGCALHLQSGLRRHGIKVPVLHPVQLLDQQLTV